MVNNFPFTDFLFKQEFHKRPLSIMVKGYMVYLNKKMNPHFNYSTHHFITTSCDCGV